MQQYTLMPDTVDKMIWAPDDGWRYHPKYVEQFADINKLYIVASCWIIIATERDQLDDPGVNGQKTLKMDLQEVGWGK